MGEPIVSLVRAPGLAPDVPDAYSAVAPSGSRLVFTAWDVVRARFGEHDPPSTLLGVAVLGYRNQLVEVEAVAAVADPA